MEDDEKGKKPMKRIENKKALRVTYKKRKDCVIKKTMELSILCGINVFTLCFGPNGKVDTWPQNPNEVKALIRMYKDSAKKSPLPRKFWWGNEDGYGWLDGLSAESVMSFLGKLDSKLEVLKARIEFLKMVNEQKNSVVVMGKETENSTEFYQPQPQPQQQDTQLNFEMENLSMLLDLCYQYQSSIF
ncbi:MADS-box protein SOC1-like [Camellia sinensis]|uniref:MADS-box protein SOC1-like n=1 Tax=Camellia sinensis TaxID=4442 RepID=UPI0010360CDC|nr:MADS-box protein SOC1-like [Camellia sinensis]